MVVLMRLKSKYRVKNWQAFELGMDHLNEDDSYIKQGADVVFNVR